MRIIELRRPLGDGTNSDSTSATQGSDITPTMLCSNPSQHDPVTSMWRKNPFALPERTAEEPSQLTTIFDEDHLAVCPTEPIALEYAPKSRPAPIYEEKQHEEYWTFLKSGPDVHLTSRPAPSRCPSLVSGGALSSRNSSTRSTRSSVWEPIDEKHNNVRGICLIPECGGLCFKDVTAHTRMTHFEQRIEICPVKTCERYMKGFTRAGERKQHTFTHFKGSLICGFCPASVSFSQASDRVNLFLTHLVKHHGVQAQHPDQEPEISFMEKSRRRLSDTSPVSTCSICSEPFTAQVLYEHLPGCVIRHITRNQDVESQECPVVLTQSSSNYGLSNSFKKPLSRIASVDQLSISQDQHVKHSTKDWIESIEPESQDVADITASSRCLSLTSSKVEESSEEETDWTEDVTSRESSPGISQLPRRLSPAKRKIVEKIMQQFQKLFQEILRTHTGDSSSGSSYSGSAGWSSNASTYSSASFVSRKRSLSGGGSLPPNENDEDDSNKRRRPDPKTKAKGGVGELRFACPYYKRNPGRHPTFTSCRDPGFVTIARLKEHLYRRHVLPPQCHRCCATFANDVALREHQRDPRGCEIQKSVPLEGFDKDQERRLKSKKRSQTYQSEEEKWKGVYRILFPDDTEEDMPNPYIEYQPCTGETSEPSNVTRFQEFSRLELPRLVRRTLETAVEQEAQPLEDKLKERLVDIVKECQTQLVALFQATAATAAAAGSLPPSMTLTPPQETTIHQSYMATTPTPLDPFPNFDDLPMRSMQGNDMMGNMSHITGTGIPPCSESPDSGYNSTSTSSMLATALYSPPPPPPPTQPLSQPPIRRSRNKHHRYNPHPLTQIESFSPSLPMIESLPHLDMHATTTTTTDDQTYLTAPIDPNADINANANEYIDLDGYYGLFENRDSMPLPLPGASTERARLDSDAMSAWSFISSTGGTCSSGNVDDPGLDLGARVGMHSMAGEEFDARRGGEWIS